MNQEPSVTTKIPIVERLNGFAAAMREHNPKLVSSGYGGFAFGPEDYEAIAALLTKCVEALEEARQIIAAMPISEMVGRIVGENKVRTYEEARGIFVRSLSSTDAALSRARATVGNKDG